MIRTTKTIVSDDRIEAEVRIRVVKKLKLDCLAAQMSEIHYFANQPFEETNRQHWSN